MWLAHHGVRSLESECCSYRFLYFGTTCWLSTVARGTVLLLVVLLSGLLNLDSFNYSGPSLKISLWILIALALLRASAAWALGDSLLTQVRDELLLGDVAEVGLLVFAVVHLALGVVAVSVVARVLHLAISTDWLDPIVGIH